MKRSILIVLLLAAMLVPPAYALPLSESETPGAQPAPLHPDAPDAAIPLSAPYTQDFNSLLNTGTSNPWTNDSTLDGWYSTRTTYRADTGASNSGGQYSYGAWSSTERALGSVGSGSTSTIYYGVRLRNDSGNAVSTLTISYTGEQWRNGGNTTQHWLAAAYQIGASVTSLTSGAWTGVSQLNFTGPIATSTASQRWMAMGRRIGSRSPMRCRLWSPAARRSCCGGRTPTIPVPTTAWPSMTSVSAPPSRRTRPSCPPVRRASTRWRARQRPGV